MSWDEVHEEAEHMEHAVSDLLIDRIDKYLGYPTVDPHGDPIPGADGTIQSANMPHLAELTVGQQFKIKRVLDQTPEFLRFLSTNGLSLEQLGQVVSCLPEAGLYRCLLISDKFPSACQRQVKFWSKFVRQT